MKDIAKDVQDILKTFSKEFQEDVEEAAQETAQEVVEELRGSSPNRTGKYAKGWKKIKRGTTTIVYNSDRYMITHLLEKGHVKRGGGRVRAYPHIARAEKHGIDSFIKKIERL